MHLCYKRLLDFISMSLFIVSCCLYDLSANLDFLFVLVCLSIQNFWLEKSALILEKNTLLAVIYGLDFSFKGQFLRVSSRKNRKKCPNPKKTPLPTHPLICRTS